MIYTDIKWLELSFLPYAASYNILAARDWFYRKTDRYTKKYVQRAILDVVKANRTW